MIYLPGFNLRIVLVILYACQGILAQVPDGNNPVFESKVDDLMKLSPQPGPGLQIESASKQSESIFEAPVGASVITREEMLAAGCTSIMEALRLLPGVLVRETTNGNYDINIRGYNHAPPGSDFFSKDNTNNLVMIDYRPIFNYFSGGVFWESLPIDINDIDRIELVRGPVAALYGTNAVSGVIHIITRKIKKEGLTSYGHLELGSQNTLRFGAGAGYSWGEKLQFQISGNLSQKDRFTQDMYEILSQSYVSDPRSIRSWQTGELLNFDEAFPSPERGIERYGINGVLRFQPKDDLNFDFSLGYENSLAVRPFPENTYTPHSTLRSESWYINNRMRYKDLTFQAAYWRGEQEPGINVFGSHFQMNILDLMTEYDFKFKNFSIKPGISFRNAVNDDRDFFSNQDTTSESGILNGRKQINNLASSLRLDYNFRNLRLIGAIRMDKFSLPDELYFSYQLAANYKIKEKHLLRLVFAKSNPGANLINIFANYRSGPLADVPFPGFLTNINIKGNNELSLLSSQSLELGYRFQPSEKFFFDVEGFWTRAKDFSSLILDISLDTNFVNSNPILLLEASYRQTNLDLQTIQRGLTFFMNYTPIRNLQLKTFFTIQGTRLRNFSPYNVGPSVRSDLNFLTQEDRDDDLGSPRLYGGFLLFYAPVRAFYFNLNAYFFTRQELSHASDAILGREILTANIDAKLLLNLTLNFRPSKGLRLFLNFRNLLGQDSFEFYFTDRVGRIFNGGFNFEF